MNMKNISKMLYENIILAVIILIYFGIINYTYSHTEEEQITLILKVLSMVVLAVSLILMEMAFRKSSGKLAINSIETLVIASHTLMISHIVEVHNFEFTGYILASSYLFSIYYLFKALIIYTKEKKDYVDSLSDIKEIVSNNPVKKEATRKGEKK